MRVPMLFIAAITICLGCTPKKVPMPVAPGAKFEIYLTTTQNDPNAMKAIDPVSSDPLFLKMPPVITTKDVATVTQSKTDIRLANGKPSGQQYLGITVKLTQIGAKKMAAATVNPKGRQIVVVVNGEVICAPKMHSQIKGSFEISGNNALFISAFEALTKQ